MSDLSIKIKPHGGGIRLELMDSNRLIATSDAKTLRESALWLARTVNRIAQRTEDLLVDLGFCTEAEIEAKINEGAKPVAAEPESPKA